MRPISQPAHEEDRPFGVSRLLSNGYVPEIPNNPNGHLMPTRARCAFFFERHRKMQNGKIRFEGKTTTMVNIATLIEFHEVQNQRWQVQVSSGSIGGTFHPLMNENCDAEKAKLSIMQSIKTVIDRNQQLIWIDVPDVNGCLARLHGDAAMAVLSDLQARWTCAVDNRVQIMSDDKRPNTNIDEHDARNAYIELIRTNEQSKQALLMFYSESHEQEAGESDDDYFTRCAQQDFEDGPSGCLFHSHFATAHALAEKTQHMSTKEQ